MDKIGRPVKGTLTSAQSLNSIDTDDLPLIYIKVIDSYKERIHFLNRQLIKVKRDITAIITADRDMIHLQTIPGIGFFSAALIKSEIMDIDRFKSFNRLCRSCAQNNQQRTKTVPWPDQQESAKIFAMDPVGKCF